MKTITAVLLAFVMLAVGGCIGFYFGAARTKRSALTLAAGSTPTASVVAPAVGKFQIVPGEYVHTSGNTGTVQRGVFRINTETGEASLYQDFVDTNGKLQMFWGSVDETITTEGAKH
jgi:hypothetical protein